MTINKSTIDISKEILTNFRRDYEKDKYNFDSELIYSYNQLIKFLIMCDVISLQMAHDITEELNKELLRLQEWY